MCKKTVTGNDVDGPFTKKKEKKKTKKVIIRVKRVLRSEKKTG